MVEADIGERIQGEMSMKITLELRPKDEGEPVPSTSGSEHSILGYHLVPRWKKGHLIFLEAKVHFAAAKSFLGVWILGQHSVP